jgi:beta-glucosidase
MGTENPNSDFPGATSVYAGIRATVMAAGGSATLSPDGSYKSKPDVAIVVFGENPYAEWHGDLRSLDYHGADGSPAPDVLRPSIETPMPGQWVHPAPAATGIAATASGSNEPDLALIQRLRQRGVPVVAVFLTGRTRGIDPELQAANAFVVAWLPGSEGDGVADVLFRNPKGAVNFDFTGKLAYAWPSGGGARSAASRSPEGTKPAPLFPYGFGLSYCNQHCDAPLSRQPWPMQQSLTSLNTPASP